MADILKLEPRPATDIQKRQPHAKPAEIIIFPGVRYEQPKKTTVWSARSGK